VRDVDWDLLADHLGGALAGTADERRVADLIATDPAWARAATDLSAALAAVATDLRRLPAPAMPDDVVARLEDTLHSAGRRPAGSHVAMGRSPRAAPTGGSRRPPARSASRRRRVTRWGSGVAVAAALVAFVAFGISNLGGMLVGGQDDSGGIATDGGDQEAAPGQPRLAADQPRVLASGHNYGRGELSQRAGAPLDAPTDPLGPLDHPGPAGAPDADAEDAQGLVPEGLRHLWPLPDECLSAVVASYLPETVRPEMADFAYFEGQPSIVIWVTTEQDAIWVSVVGPGCGTAAAGIDERHRSPLG
jgi:hypothetical protein